VVEEYRNAVAAMRGNAKWVLTTLGGVGAVLVSGIGLSGLANLHQPLYIALAIVGLLIALAGVGWAIAQTSAILQPSTVHFARLIALEPDGQAANRPAYLTSMFPAGSERLRSLGNNYEALQAAFTAALTQRSQALLANYQSPADRDTATAAQAAQARARLYAETIEGIEAEAAYFEVKARLKTGRQLAAAACVVLGVILFAVVLSLPAWKNPDLHGARLSKVDLNGVRLERANFSNMKLTDVSLRDADLRSANFSGAKLTRVNLMGADVTNASFSATTWHDTVCPDGTISRQDGSTCVSHLQPKTEVVSLLPIRTSVSIGHHRHRLRITIKTRPRRARVTAFAARGSRRLRLHRIPHTKGPVTLTGYLPRGRWTVTLRFQAAPGYRTPNQVKRTVRIGPGS
jgi:uncharacterized protein YjbI with pentapeptide repeats